MHRLARGAIEMKVSVSEVVLNVVSRLEVDAADGNGDVGQNAVSGVVPLHPRTRIPKPRVDLSSHLGTVDVLLSNEPTPVGVAVRERSADDVAVDFPAVMECSVRDRPFAVR
jgi:hypothetical protein